MIKASIIIPHYNQVELLKIVLPSIANQTFKDYEVIVIDDCTPDRSAVEYIKAFIKDHKNMRLVENAENMRFVKTVNKGIRLSNGEYICLLNQDTELKSNFVERNVEILDSDASIGGLSCIIVDKYGKNYWSGGSFKEGYSVNLTDDFEGIRTADFVAGTAAFYRKEVFYKIGLFDESYGMYHEDVEFGLRIRAETDYKACAFSDKLVVHYHVNSVPRPELYYLLNRNGVLVVRKYCPQLLQRRAVLKWSADNVRLLGKDVLGLHRQLFFCHLAGFRGKLAGLRNRPSEIPRLVEK
jgi:GT2 family glycosyltransferase